MDNRCIICWKKVRVRKGEHADLGGDEDDIAPKSVVSAPGFLRTFNEIWGLVQNNTANSSPKATISLEAALLDGKREDIPFSKGSPPTMCQRCCEKVVAIENLMKSVRHQFWEIKMFLVESNKRRKEGHLEKPEVDNFAEENDADFCQSDGIQFKQEDEESNLENQKVLPSCN